MKPEQLPTRLAETARMYTTLIRRAMENPKAASLLPGFLNALPGPLWPGVVRAAQQTPVNANAKAYRMVDEAIASAIRTGKHPEIVAELYNSLPRETVALQETVLEVARQTVRIMEKNGRTALYPIGYLQILNNYVGRLLQNGGMKRAAAEGSKAVQFADDPNHSALPEIGPARASAYENQAHILREAQRPAEALVFLERARKAYEELITRHPESRLNLAICLNNHMSVLSALKRYEEAARFGRQAAAVFSEMVAGRQRTAGEFGSVGLQASIDNVWPNYAICLIALATALDEIKDHGESLACAREAVAILSQLAREAADFYPLLGQAWNNLAMALNGLDRFQEAEGAIFEAVQTFRRLEGLRSGTFTWYLAHCLRRQSFVLAQLDRLREALPPCRESLTLYKRLEKKRPGVYRGELSGTEEQLEIIEAELRKVPAGTSRPGRRKARY